MLSQRGSILKKKGANANGEFQSMHLAVFAFEIQFQKDVSSRTAFYFQKKYQVIGKVAQIIPACPKGSKYPLKSLENIIHFRLFSQNNVIYQWSAYSVHENGEEQFVDSCAINLKEIVTNYIIPQKSTGSRSMDSLISLSLGNHEIKLKFSKIGMILSVNLLISDDPKSFKEAIDKKYCPENQENLPQVNLLKTDSISGVIPLSSRRNNSEDDKKELGSSIRLLKNQSKKPAEQPKDTKEKVKEEALDLDTLIFNEGNSQANLAEKKMQQLRQQLEEEKQIQRKISQKQDAIKIQQLPQRQFPTKQLQIENDISSGILKLQSDQIQKDKVDIKLQLEQLEMIEEEIRSSKETVNDTISPRFQSKKSTDRNSPGPITPNKNKLPFKPIRQEQNEQASTVVQSKFTLKKGIVYFIILFLISIAGATAIKGLNSKKGKSKRK